VSGGPDPLVSVVLRTYGHAEFIAQAIESVLIQRTPFPIELVIGEDCSSDGTREIVRGYAERHPELIRAVLPEQNLGHGQILLRAIEATRGRYLAYLDGDDYWTAPDKLRRQVEYLEASPDCRSCFHDVSLVYDAAGMPSGSVSPGFAEARLGLTDILGECFVPAPSMMFHKEVADSLPAWSFESAWIDWVIHIRAAEMGPLGYIAEPMAAYRVHDGGMFSALDRTSQLEEDLRFYKRLLAELPAQAELIERCMQYRRCQLAIERLGVPFGACVILVDPRRELRPYFNGRHTRNLPRRDGREVTELETIRRAAADFAPAVRDYGQATDADRGDAGCFVVVPASAADWLAGKPLLREFLEAEGSSVWEDTSVTVHELAPLSGREARDPRATRRVEVEMLPLPAELRGANFEAPAAAASLPAHAIFLAGWVFGREAAVDAVELLDGEELLLRVPLSQRRPDIESAFPDAEVGLAGFRTTLNALALPQRAELTAVAAFEGGGRVPFAQLRLRSDGG
jgi:glycosyltransferase involved in cell wall biosynthesis